MSLSESLSEHATLEEINGMLLTGDRHNELRRELSAMLSAPSLLEQCDVRHARFRPGHKLRANFDARLRSESNGQPCVRAMEVTWRPQRDKDKRPKGAEDLGKMQEEAKRRGVAAPFHQLMADLPSLGLQLRVSPLDAQFPQLVRMSDPEYVGEMVARVSGEGHAAHVNPGTGRYAVKCIRYRPGRRHVLRYDSLDAPECGTIFAKMYADQKGERAFRVANTVADWLAQYGKGVTSLRPLAYLPEDSVVLYRRILGQSLTQYLQSPGDGVGQSLRAVGVALRALHELPEGLIGPLKLHDLAAEVKQIKRSGEHLPALLPSAGAAVKAMLDRAMELDGILPREQPTFTHGDFISEHIWVTAAGLVLIDFDNCFLADPALDIGKFLADLHLVYATHNLPGVEEAQEAFLAGYGISTNPERLTRSRLYEAIKLAKMAARRVYVFEHDWADRTTHLIARAQSLMNDFERKLGLPPGQIPA